MSKYNVTVEGISIEALLNKLGGVEGAEAFLRGERVLSPVVRIILSPLSFESAVVVNETDGTETMAAAKDIFSGYLDADFKNWKTDKASGATKAQPVSVYEMVKDANFAEMFISLGRDLDSLCMTQGQIIRFCVEHRDKLRTGGYATLFLFKVNTEKGAEYFVAGVGLDGDGLEADVYRFGPSYVWCADYRHRVVVPQL